MNLYNTIKKILFRLEAERAHAVSLYTLDILYKTGLIRLLANRRINSPVKVMGIEFPNPLGLAAGLDKNGDHIDALAACGFGFVEIGTVTPRAQDGNPRPRLFRLVNDQAIINRMGFNNKGMDHLVRQVAKSRRQCVIGINIGKNRDTPLANASDDYLHALKCVYHHADYVTINISSPNTPGLRDLQHGQELEKLLTALKHEQAGLHKKHGRYVPLVVKIAPDLEADEIQQLADTFIRLEIDGVIATNTTNDRNGLTDKKLSLEQGGLSGRPLARKSDKVLACLVEQLHGRIPVIAAGGIFSATDAQRKLDLGASLVQVYTGFIYKGPALVSEVMTALSAKTG